MYREKKIEINKDNYGGFFCNFPTLRKRRVVGKEEKKRHKIMKN